MSTFNRTFLKTFGNVFGSPVQLAWADAAGVQLIFQAASPSSAGVFELQSTGEGTPTSVHPDDIYAPDHEGVYRLSEPDEPVVRYGRVVENLLISPEDFSDAAWLELGTVTKEPLSDGSCRISGINQTTTNAVQQSYVTGSIASRSFVGSILIKGEGDNIGKQLVMRLTRGTGTYLEAARDVVLTSEYQRITTPVLTGLADNSNVTIRVYGDPSSTASGCVIKEPQLEESTGRSDISTPSKFVTEKTVLNYVNGNTVDVDGVVTEAKGLWLDPQQELYDFPDCTNSHLYSNDLTQISQSGSVVTSFDQVGLTGEPDTASLVISSTIADFNNSLVSGLTADTAEHSIRYYIKKGSVTDLQVRWAMFGGTAISLWDIFDTSTGLFTTSVIANQDVQEVGDWWVITVSDVNNGTNGALHSGVGRHTSGTGVVVGNMEFHLNKTLPEVRDLLPIFTTTAAVSVTSPNYLFDQANWDNTQGAMYFGMRVSASKAENSVISTAQNINNKAPYIHNTTGKLSLYDGTTLLLHSADYLAGDVLKIAIAWDAEESKMDIAINGVWSAITNYDGLFDTTDILKWCLGLLSGTGTKNLKIYSGGTWQQRRDMMTWLSVMTYNQGVPVTDGGIYVTDGLIYNTIGNNLIVQANGQYALIPPPPVYENHILWSNDMSQAIWGKYGFDADGITDNGDGSFTVYQNLDATSTNVVRQIFGAGTLTGGTDYVLRGKIRTNNADKWLKLKIYGSNDENATIPQEYIEEAPGDPYVKVSLRFTPVLPEINVYPFFTTEAGGDSFTFRDLQITGDPGPALFSTGDSICYMAHDNYNQNLGITYSKEFTYDKQITSKINGVTGSVLSQIEGYLEDEVITNGNDYPVIFLEGGINDLSLPSDPNTAMRTTMASMITTAKAHSDLVVVIAIPPFYNVAKHQWWLDYNNWLETTYGGSADPDVIVYHPADDIGDVDGYPTLTYYDDTTGQLHPNTLAHRVMAQSLIELVSMPSGTQYVNSFIETEGSAVIP